MLTAFKLKMCSMPFFGCTFLCLLPTIPNITEFTHAQRITFLAYYLLSITHSEEGKINIFIHWENKKIVSFLRLLRGGTVDWNRLCGMEPTCLQHHYANTMCTISKPIEWDMMNAVNFSKIEHTFTFICKLCFSATFFLNFSML